MDNDYFDLVITDIMMPVLDGYELVRQLRDTGNITPVLMITAKDAFDDMNQGFVSGTDDYMVKPVNVNEMKSTPLAASVPTVVVWVDMMSVSRR